MTFFFLLLAFFLSPIAYYLFCYLLKSIGLHWWDINSSSLYEEPSTNCYKYDKALIVLPIFNGAHLLESRLNNVRQYCSPDDFDLLIISDGSTDDTLKLSSSLSRSVLGSSWNCYIHDNGENKGRAFSHNFSVHNYSYRYFVFSDLDTQFTTSFPALALQKIKSDSSIGAVSARVVFEGSSSYGSFLSKLFPLELLLRRLSVLSDLCMKASGPAVLFERYLWSPISGYEDVDHVIGFFCLSHNKRLSYDDNLIVKDIPNSSSSKDLRARSRMTRKSLLSFAKALSSVDLFSNRRVFMAVFGYFLHKPIRFFSFPFVVISFLVLLLQYLPMPFYPILPLLYFSCSVFRLPVVVAASFLLGIYGFLIGNSTGSYLPTNVSRN